MVRMSEFSNWLNLSFSKSLIRRPVKTPMAISKQNLYSAIDKYFGDKNVYPNSLEDLVTSKYIRKIPKDPITDSDTTWVIVAPKSGVTGSVYDIKSGAAGSGADGTPYESW